MGDAIVKAGEFGREQVELIKRTVAKGTTDDELKLFLHTAGRLGLDPLAKQIHAVVRNGKDGPQMAIQVGIDGFRAVATRTGQADGQEGPFWCGEDGVWKDVWLGPGQPLAAKVVVYRKGQSRGYTGIATWDSYVQTYKDRQTGQAVPNGTWQKLGDVMLAKCAEALALRKAFPADLSGVYAPEEMDQAGAPIHRPVDPAGQDSWEPSAGMKPSDGRSLSDGTVVPEPEPRDMMDADEEPPEDFTITFGKNNGRRLGELPSNSLHWYAEECNKADVRKAARAVLDNREAEKLRQGLADKRKNPNEIVDPETGEVEDITNDDMPEGWK